MQDKAQVTNRKSQLKLIQANQKNYPKKNQYVFYLEFD